MDSTGPTPLFSAIDAFLCTTREERTGPTCHGFWQTKPCITAVEIGMLMALSRESLCAQAIAHHLERDLGSTQAFLDALQAVGLVERCDDRYTTTTAMRLYCLALSQGSPLGGCED